MEKFLGTTTDDVVTPDTLAWKLIMDDDIKNYMGILMPYTTSDNKNSNVSICYDNLIDTFQILITIYMEMVFYVLKMNHLASFMDEEGNLSDIDLESTFKPDIKNIKVDDLTSIFREKFKKIRIFLSVREIYDTDENSPHDFGTENDYYCRIILKDTSHGATYFLVNRKKIDMNKRYTFVIRNDVVKKQRKLDDFYAVCALPHLKVRISFSRIHIYDGH